MSREIDTRIPIGMWGIYWIWLFGVLCGVASMVFGLWQKGFIK